jgi:hypothetical protein
VVKGAWQKAVRLLPVARELVIQDNDISDWGTYDHTNADGWNI